MIAIALAGGAGAAVRVVVDGLVRRCCGDRLPWGTFLINIVGSALLGWLLGSGAGSPWAAVIGTGFLGGFTTFSTASLETAHLALDGRWRDAATYGLGTLAICVTAAAATFAVA